MKKIALSILLTMAAAVAAMAQNITVKGTVTDESGDPVFGAVIIEKGTNNGVQTGDDGTYSLSVPKTATLVFSCLSFKEREVAVSGRTSISLVLEADNTFLGEAVVVGYGTMRRSDLTGSVASVSSKDIGNYKTGSAFDALGGKIAGVSIIATDGTPGAGYDVKVRGVGSVNGSTAPLYIVDGFEVDNLDFLANQDIQSVEVLKDASASAIYGSRAANGVVLVTTKSGHSGRPQLSYNGSGSYRVLSKRMELLSPYDFVKLQLEVNPTKYAATYYKEGSDANGVPYKYQTPEDYRGVAGIDWQNEAFRPTWSQNHDISIQGGGKDSQYNASFSHFDENGIFTGSGYNKNTARLKLMRKLTPWLTFNGSLSYANTVRSGIGTSSLLSTLLRYRPTGGLQISDYDLRNSTYDPLSMEDGNFNSNYTNPIIQAESADNKQKQEQWIANVSLGIKFNNKLSFKSTGTYNANYQRNDIFYGDGTSQAYRAGGVYGQSQMGRTLRRQISNVLTYHNRVNRNNTFDIMLGQEASSGGSELLLGQAKDFPFDLLGVDNLGLGATPSLVNSSRTENRRLSFFARGFYNYKDRYLLTATLRADASSVFSASNKWGFFPSFSAAWNIAKEDFMKDNDWISQLKIRAGWGIVGNDRIGSYLSMDLYTNSRFGLGTLQSSTLASKHLANKNLKWEGASTVNLGLDASVLDERVNLTVDAFLKDTKDLLIAQNLAYVTGFGSQWQNVGKIRNKGVEITLNSVNFNKRNFFWSTDFNVSFIKNTLENLQDGTNYMMSLTGFNSNFTGYDYIAYVGGALGNMYGYVFDGVYQESDFNMVPGSGRQLKPGVADISGHAGTDAVPGMVKYKDINGDGLITTADRTVIGNGQPDWYGGLTNTFNVYDFDLSFMLQFSYGADVYNATRMFCTQTMDDRTNQYSEVLDRWSPTNASNAVPASTGYIRYELYSRFIEDGSYLRLKNITLGYTIPDKFIRKAHISRLRFYVNAQNLFCLSRYSGYDPEVSTLKSPLMPSLDWGAYPKSKVYTFGIDLQF